jgi:hypothetical protein
MSLAEILVRGDVDALTEWVGEHVGVEDDMWDRFAVLLAGLAAAGLDYDARRLMGGYTGEIVFAPDLDEAGEQVDRLAVLMVTMALNADHPGILGVLAAVRELGQVDELAGALGQVASRALSERVTGVVRVVEPGL